MPNNQNIYWDIKDITTESGIDEPVTLGEMKDYLRLEGFVDEDESTTESLSDFDFDDTLISSFITAARKRAEKYCGISIVFHTWKDCFTNGAGDIEFRYGPIQSITSLAYKDDGTVVDEDNYETTGFDFQTLDTVYSDKMILIYDAGYEEVPEEISLAIKQMVAYWYKNRADESSKYLVPSQALATLEAFRRPWTYVA